MKASNLRPTVLETVALPAELIPYMEVRTGFEPVIEGLQPSALTRLGDRTIWGEN